MNKKNELAETYINNPVLGYMHSAMLSLKAMREVHHPKIWGDEIVKFKDLHSKLLCEFRSGSSYNKFKAIALKHYKYFTDEPVNQYQKEYINNPQIIIFNEFLKESLESSFMIFMSYWNNVLDGYIQKSAKIKRLDYIIENTQSYILISEAIKVPNVARMAKEYIQNCTEIKSSIT